MDVTIEAGLGTIWASAKARSNDGAYPSQPRIFDDTYPLDVQVLKNTTGALVGGVREDYYSIANQFV